METINYDLLISAANNYYNGLATGMSDEEYDKLLAEAKRDIPDFDIFKEIRCGTDREDVVHSIPFTPQEFKIQFRSTDEIKEYIESQENSNWICSPKWDGSSIRAYYRNGKLFDIITRSNEEWGKRKFDSLNKKVPSEVNPEVICIDFEAVCSKEDYSDDTRSHANGLVNSCYKQDEVDAYLTLIPFKVTTKTVMKYLDAMHLVFSDGDFGIIDKDSIDYDKRFIEYKGKHYPIDGVVLYYDTEMSHRIYKHYFNMAPTSVVTNVAWNFTDKLCWVPKVQFESVKIDGRNVWQASINGFGRLQEIKAGVGSIVEIILANSTIPQVHKVLKESDEYCEPKICPYCGSEIINVNNKLRCSNQFCSNVINWIASWYLGNLNYPVVDVLDIESFYRIIDKAKSDGKSVDDLLYCLAWSISIERFSKYDTIAEYFKSSKSEFKNGVKSIDVIGDLFTYNQYDIYATYCELIDKLIWYILKEC